MSRSHIWHLWVQWNSFSYIDVNWIANHSSFLQSTILNISYCGIKIIDETFFTVNYIKYIILSHYNHRWNIFFLATNYFSHIKPYILRCLRSSLKVSFSTTCRNIVLSWVIFQVTLHFHHRESLFSILFFSGQDQNDTRTKTAKSNLTPLQGLRDRR